MLKLITSNAFPNSELSQSPRGSFGFAFSSGFSADTTKKKQKRFIFWNKWLEWGKSLGFIYGRAGSSRR